MISIFIFKYTRKNHWKKCNIFWECSSFLSEAERKRVCECVYERLFHVTVSAWKSDKECACGMLFFCVNIYHTGKKGKKATNQHYPVWANCISSENKIRCEATTKRGKQTCDQSVSPLSECSEKSCPIGSKQRGSVCCLAAASASETRDRVHVVMAAKRR